VFRFRKPARASGALRTSKLELRNQRDASWNFVVPVRLSDLKFDTSSPFDPRTFESATLGDLRISEVIRANLRRKNLAEVDQLRLQAFHLKANGTAT